MIRIDVKMPVRCAECPCFDDNVYGHCRVLDRWLDARDGAWFAESRPEWCPLKMDIREIDGLWCDDITFCQETCERMDCPRNKHHIRDRSVPHSFSVEIPQDCPKKQEGR